MRHKQNGETRAFPKRQQLVLHLAAGQRVERRKRLVHQQDVGFHRHPARDRHALLHPARERVRITVGEFGEIHFRNALARFLLCRATRQASARVEREKHVLLHRAPRQQLIKLLEHHHPVGPGPPNHFILEADLPFDRLQIAADRLQQGRFATSRRPQHDEAVRTKDLEVDAVRRGDQVVLRLVLQRDAANVEQRLRRIHR